WFVVPDDGDVMKLAEGEETARLVDDRLRDGRAIWPGRDGAMLVLREGEGAALAHGGKRLELADGLRELGLQHFDAMLAAAPTATRGGRRQLVRSHLGLLAAAPWLAVGGSLWICDGEAVYRLRRDKGSQPPHEVQLETIREGSFAMLGPLRDGGLLLAPKDRYGASDRLTSWLWVTNPDGQTEVVSVPSPPKKQGQASLGQPASFGGQWRLDGTGALWLHQGFDRVYRITGPDHWPMLMGFGLPEFEHPAGFVWGFHSARVFHGYEIGGEDFRRSCVATYLRHTTPLMVDDGDVVCLTPDGLARLQFDPEAPEKASITASVRVRWRRPPASFLGGAGGRAFFLTRTEDGTAGLVGVDVPPRPKGP
ncbi:MAG: hypothetical protein ACYTG0_20575, partial [Planctomycetota bacterium]